MCPLTGVDGDDLDRIGSLRANSLVSLLFDTCREMNVGS